MERGVSGRAGKNTTKGMLQMAEEQKKESEREGEGERDTSSSSCEGLGSLGASYVLPLDQLSMKIHVTYSYYLLQFITLIFFGPFSSQHDFSDLW